MSTGSPHEHGFTLVELVVTLVILGILAAFIAPRLMARTEFDARGFFDTTAAVLRYAQKSAVAQRRTVCVTFTGNASVTLTIASVFGATTCNTNLSGPDDSAPYTLVAPSGVAYIGPENFSFLPSGEASANREISVTGLPGRTINVWAATGYVQEN
jgi:MSHA pilin protein MshC